MARQLGAKGQGRMVALGWAHCPACAAPANPYRVPQTGQCTACGRSFVVHTGAARERPVVETTRSQSVARRWD